jgi:hypothetical protein
VLSIGLLTLFSAVALLWQPMVVSRLLELKPLPQDARSTLFFAVMANAALCFAFERWGTGVVAAVLGFIARGRQVLMRGRSGRIKEGKAYKAVETGLNRTSLETA